MAKKNVAKEEVPATEKPVEGTLGGMMDSTSFIAMGAVIIMSGALANSTISNNPSDKETKAIEDGAIRSATRIWNKAHALAHATAFPD